MKRMEQRSAGLQRIVSLLIACSLSLLPPAAALAQQGAEDTPNEARAFELQQPPNRVRRMLSQLDALLTGAPADDQTAQQLDDALELIDDLLADSQTAESVVEVSPGRYAPLGELCHLRIAQLPAELLQQYRDRVDPIAEQLYEQGFAERDEAALTRIVREMFCSRWGDDALLALSELALEQGDATAARRYLRQISPLVSAPGGSPLAWALRGVDLKQHGPVVVELMQKATPAPGVLVYPDSGILPATLLARLVVASVWEGDVARARTELGVLRQLDLNAQGRLAGREVVYVDALEEMVSGSAQGASQTFKTGTAVGRLVGRVWPRPVAAPRNTTFRFETDLFSNRRLVADEDQTGPPQYEPIVWRDGVVYRAGPSIRAVGLASGEPLITRTGQLYSSDSPAEVASPRLRRPQLARRFSLTSNVSEAVTLAGDEIFARVEAANVEGHRILGIDLSREGLVTLEIDPPEQPWSLGGPPVVSRGRLYVALTADELRRRVAVACYSAATGRPLWQTSLGSGPPESNLGATVDESLKIVVHGDTVYFNTNLGAIAALDALGGGVRWIREHKLPPPSALADGDAVENSTGVDCLVNGDRLYAAPRAGRTILALDAATGLVLWERPTPARNPQLLGVAEGVLVVGGQQLTGLSDDDGALRYQWPDSPKAGLRGMGRGALSGGEVFWTSRDRLYILSAQTGAQTRPSIDIADLGGAGANVTPAGGGLIVAGSEAMTVLGPVERERQDDTPKISANEQEERTLMTVNRQ